MHYEGSVYFSTYLTYIYKYMYIWIWEIWGFFEGKAASLRKQVINGFHLINIWQDY